MEDKIFAKMQDGNWIFRAFHNVMNDNHEYAEDKDTWDALKGYLLKTSEKKFWGTAGEKITDIKNKMTLGDGTLLPPAMAHFFLQRLHRIS